MTAIKPERFGDADKAGPDTSGPEKYAPPDRRPPEKLGDVDQAAANAFEGEIREFVRRDVALLRRQQRNGTETAGDPAADNLNALIRRVSSASMEEIDRVINELQTVRDMLRNEGERVSREVAGYASLSHAAMTAMKVIGDSLTQWKSSPNRSGPRPAS
jgi:two-component sensor histidine kinase